MNQNIFVERVCHIGLGDECWADKNNFILNNVGEKAIAKYLSGYEIDTDTVEEDGIWYDIRVQTSTISSIRFYPADVSESSPSNEKITKLIRTMDRLEKRLEFVGVSYLMGKVWDDRNTFDRAIDDGIVEMYETGNIDGRSMPVSACKLDRLHPVVKSVLGGEFIERMD